MCKNFTFKQQLPVASASDPIQNEVPLHDLPGHRFIIVNLCPFLGLGPTSKLFEVSRVTFRLISYFKDPDTLCQCHRSCRNSSSCPWRTGHHKSWFSGESTCPHVHMSTCLTLDKFNHSFFIFIFWTDHVCEMRCEAIRNNITTLHGTGEKHCKST